MDVLDTQYHLTPGKMESTLASMDALGIDSVLIEEYWFDPKDYAEGVLNPGYRLANGAWRAMHPTAELASVLHPNRFSYFVRIDRTDPQLECVMRMEASSPHCRGYRALASWTPEETGVFAGGGYDEMFALAEDIGMPMCLFIPGQVHHLPRYAEKFPDLTFVVDHCGLLRSDDIGTIDLGTYDRLGYFDVVLNVAEHPNVMLKWGAAPRIFDQSVYPYDPIRPYLRRAIEAFGADRLLWASDASVMFGWTWSDILNCVRDDPELSVNEREWILGRTARRVFDWPAAVR
jgi:predicted TIM-barrel fold metal-dependent hydrolase